MEVFFFSLVSPLGLLKKFGRKERKKSCFLFQQEPDAPSQLGAKWPKKITQVTELEKFNQTRCSQSGDARHNTVSFFLFFELNTQLLATDAIIHLIVIDERKTVVVVVWF